MQITVHATRDNKKNILDLLEEQGCHLPCNCHGANACGGKQYTFPCTLVPHEDMTITLHSRQAFGGISLSDKPDTSHQPDTLLIDLGTTTIAMVYYNRIHKSVYFSEVFPNPQLPFGADVISRIRYDSDPSHHHELTQIMRRELTDHYTGFIKSHNTDSITSCLIGGNTTMIHLLLGLSLQGMTSAPFMPSDIEPESLCRDYQDIPVIILPWLSAFIGGDIVSGMLYLNFDSRKDTCLLVDLGTNGELALLHEQNIYLAGTAAGPTFEGSGLSCGTPAIAGAISDVTLNKILPRTQTIQNKLPTGICGSGAISILSQLITNKYMDHEGILHDNFPEKGLIISRTPSGQPIRFTRQDVREIQLAIAAIGAGIDTLCHNAGINPVEVHHLYLAGGLGYHIDLTKASVTGLFSGIDCNKIDSIGNGCLLGLASVAASHSNSNDFLRRFTHLYSAAKEVVLADEPYFKESFLRHMMYE